MRFFWIFFFNLVWFKNNFFLNKSFTFVLFNILFLVDRRYLVYDRYFLNMEGKKEGRIEGRKEIRKEGGRREGKKEGRRD